MANNTTLEIPYEDPLSKPPWNTIINSFVSARIVLSTIGIILNGCNYVIINKLPETCSNHFKLIQSLATADLALCFTDLIMLIAYAYYSNYYDTEILKALQDLNQRPRRLTSERPRCVWAVLDCLQVCVFLATLFSVSMISVDCFLKIRIPLTYRAKVTKRRLKIAILFSWLISFAIGCLVTFGVGYMFWENLTETRGNLQTSVNDNRTSNSSIVSINRRNKFDVELENTTNTPTDHMGDVSLCWMFASWALEAKGLLTGLCSLLCTALMISLYCCICCRVTRLHHRTEQQTGVQTSSRKTIITTSLIVGSFLLAWGPPSWLLLMVPFMIGGGGSVDPAARALLTSAHVLQVLNASFDALIYALRLDEIRKSYRLAFNKLRYKFTVEPRP